MRLYLKDYNRSKLRNRRPCQGILLFLQILFDFALTFVNANIALSVFSFILICTPLEHSLIDPPIEGSTLPAPLNSYSVLAFVSLVMLSFLLSMCGCARNCCGIFLYELLNYAFMLLNIFKLLGVGYLMHGVFTQSPSLINEPAVSFPLIFLFLIHFFLKLVALCLMRPRDFCKHFLKYMVSFIWYMLEYEGLSLLSKIFLIFNLRKPSPAAPTSFRCCNCLITLVWAAYNGMFLIALVYLKGIILPCLSAIVLLASLLRASEALVFWWCRYQHSLRDKLYSPLREFLKQLREKYSEQGQTTRRGLVRAGSTTNVANSAKETPPEQDPKTPR